MYNYMIVHTILYTMHELGHKRDNYTCEYCYSTCENSYRAVIIFSVCVSVNRNSKRLKNQCVLGKCPNYKMQFMRLGYRSFKCDYPMTSVATSLLLTCLQVL